MAGNWTLHIEQGATFDTTLTWKNAAGTPVDLTGFTARAQVRSMHTSTVSPRGGASETTEPAPYPEGDGCPGAQGV